MEDEKSIVNFQKIKKKIKGKWKICECPLSKVCGKKNDIRNKENDIKLLKEARLEYSRIYF